jgi:capsular polysaccharide export protein
MPILPGTGLSPTVTIEGPVLLLMGPLGSFFARLAAHLEKRGVPVWKVSFPLHEFGFPAHQRLPYKGPMGDFRSFLLHEINIKRIRHLFMYGDFIDPHRIAIDLVREFNTKCAERNQLDAWVFELGYLRPNFVTLEKERVNARSALNQPTEFYRSLPEPAELPRIQQETGNRWRKWWKAPTFIQHACTDYPIIAGPHKLQPRPSYLLAQLRGLARKHLYQITERRILNRLRQGQPFILVPLQVASDSQINLGSHYRGMEPFIEELIASFAAHGRPEDLLAFKHHPRDRGYNHYGRFIAHTARSHGIGNRVLYFHDGPLGPLLKGARAVVTINSTVGLQALYHARPTKALGRTFYNLPCLTDQQPLEAFWRAPQGSDRSLFRRFYHHLLQTTQINGNFDGPFPFSDTFRIAPTLALHAPGPSPSPREVVGRLLTLTGGMALYHLQLLAIALGARAIARRLLERASRLVLAGLGVRVRMEGNPLQSGRPQIHIANHGHPLDVLLVQGYFCECSLTTAARHLRFLLPLFRLSASNYGHTHLNHLCPSSRLEGLRRLRRLLEQRGKLFLFPSGSLVTPISERVSGSLHHLACASNALIVPWISEYFGFPPSERQLLYRPFALILARLVSPQATIRCTRGEPIDPHHFGDREAFNRYVRDYYSRQEERLASPRLNFNPGGGATASAPAPTPAGDPPAQAGGAGGASSCPNHNASGSL